MIVCGAARARDWCNVILLMTSDFGFKTSSKYVLTVLEKSSMKLFMGAYISDTCITPQVNFYQKICL